MFKSLQGLRGWSRQSNVRSTCAKGAGSSHLFETHDDRSRHCEAYAVGRGNPAPKARTLRVLDRFVALLLAMTLLISSTHAIAQARTVVCPRVEKIGQVFVNIGGSFYWQAQVGDSRFRSNIRRDRSEKIISFEPSQSYIGNNDTEVCAYKMSIFRVNRLSYRTVYLRGQYRPPQQLTPEQQKLQQHQQKARQAVSRGLMSSRWVTPDARQNDNQPDATHPPQQVDNTPLPQYQSGH